MTMNDITTLAAEITDGWTVDITDHDYLNDSREGARVEVKPSGLVLRPRRPWSSQGRSYPTMQVVLDPARDWEVDGYTLRLYRRKQVHRYENIPGPGKRVRSLGRIDDPSGAREIVKTFRFHPPK